MPTTPTTPICPPRACFQAFAFIETNSKSEIITLNDKGCKLVTKNVKDVLAPNNSTTYTITTFCTLSNLQDFKLDPPRGTKTTTALVVISDVQTDANDNKSGNFIVDSVMLLHGVDIPKEVASMKKLFYYTAVVTQTYSHKRARTWDETFSPAKASKCRNLSRAPTAEDLPEYKDSATQPYR